MTIKTIFDKLKAIPGWVYGATVGAIVLILFRWYRMRALSSEARAQVDRALRGLESLKSKRAELSADADQHVAAIGRIDAMVSELERDVVDAHEKTEGMTPAQIEKAFQDLGY